MTTSVLLRSRSGSLWDTVTAQCSSVELSEVKRIIGESLIEQICELHTEATSLKEIILGEGTSDPTAVNSLAIQNLTRSVNELVKHMKSNKLSQTAEVAKEIRQVLHLESTRLTSEIILLQEQLDQTASDVKTTTPVNSHVCESHASSPQPPSSNSRLNSAQRFRQMITSIRNIDLHHNS